MFLKDSGALQSPLPGLQLTGTYTVNDDCSGTAALTDGLGATHNLDFIIVQSGGGASTSGNLQVILPELLFGFTDQGVTGTGFARHQ